MKRTQKGSLTEAQKTWLRAINNAGEVKARACHGFEAAKEFINQQMEEL